MLHASFKRSKDFVIKMLRDFSAEHGVQVLSNRCLLTISEGKLWMDNSIQKMAWKIVHQQTRKTGKPCRLWDHNQILHLLETNKVPSIYTLKCL